MIIGGSASQDLAAKVAEELGENLGYVKYSKFPDGEKLLRITDDVEGEEVTIIQNTAFPQDENLIELLYLVKTLKRLGAKKIRTVVPYMGYARQEKEFEPGQAISAQIVAELLVDAGIDEFITFNIHEECVLEFFKDIPAKSLSAMPAVAEYLKDYLNDDCFIISPDSGAYPFAQEIATILGCPSTYFKKYRYGSEDVETTIVKDDENTTIDISEVEGKQAVIIDDIISTGGTIVNAIEILKDHGVKSVDVCCVHPILVNNAVTRIYAAGAQSIISTNSLSSDTSRISLAKIIADELR